MGEWGGGGGGAKSDNGEKAWLCIIIQYSHGHALSEWTKLHTAHIPSRKIIII